MIPMAEKAPRATAENLRAQFPKYAHLIRPCALGCGGYRIGGRPTRMEDGSTFILGICDDCSERVRADFGGGEAAETRIRRLIHEHGLA